MDTTNYQPIGDVVGPLAVMPLPEGYVALDAVLVVKAINPDGHVTWHTRYTEAPHAIEFLGALEAAVMLMKQDIFNEYHPQSEE